MKYETLIKPRVFTYETPEPRNKHLIRALRRRQKGKTNI